VFEEDFFEFKIEVIELEEVRCNKIQGIKDLMRDNFIRFKITYKE
jgi:hypothetical protein